jgi:MFS family permease
MISFLLATVLTGILVAVLGHQFPESAGWIALYWLAGLVAFVVIYHGSQWLTSARDERESGYMSYELTSHGTVAHWHPARRVPAIEQRVKFLGLLVIVVLIGIGIGWYSFG